MSRLDPLAFVGRLADAPDMPGVFNPYAGDGPAGKARRDNLVLYLRRMAERRPRLLLVGEAPGYRGGRVTGVPFTSEAILMAEPAPFGLYGRSHGFQAARETGIARREATATILWQTLVALDVLPLLWNAFPYHPHRPGAPDSNRAPTGRELALGRKAVAELRSDYGIETVIAVGSKAARVLPEWGIAAMPVRHPGHGGKETFARQLAAIVYGSSAVK